MKLKSKLLFGTLFLLMTAAQPLFSKDGAKGKEQGTVSFTDKSDQKRVDILMDGKLFTSYIWPYNVMKPVLYPVVTSSGTEVTRGFPIKPRAGERVDHPHHVGIWFNYGDVDGLDFWNNSEAIPANKKSGYGTIHQKSIVKKKGGKGHGVLVVTATWDTPDGKKCWMKRLNCISLTRGLPASLTELPN